MKRFFLLAILFLATTARAQPLQEITIPFFDEADVGAIVAVDASGRLYYSIDRPNAYIVEQSPMGVTVNETDLGLGVELGEPTYRDIDETFPTRGPHPTGRHHCKAADIPVTHTASSIKYTIEFRVCEDGAAFRYVIPSKGKNLITGEASSWKFPPGGTFWYQTGTNNYEGEYREAETIPADTQIGPPLTVILPDGSYAAVTEAALFNYSGMTLAAGADNTFNASFLDDPDGWELSGDIVTPWRVTLIAKDLNALVNADLVNALAPPPGPEYDNSDWIRPGRCLWSWLNGGREMVTPENMRAYVDAAVELGYEYVLVDDGWEDSPPVWRDMKGWSAPGKSHMDIMAELMQYADERNVGIWVWKHFHFLNDPEYRDKYFADLERIGVVGVKVDFMDNESLDRVRFYENCLRDAARHRLMINFHGANKPTGEARTYPNEVTREGIRGLENRLMPESHTTALPFTRLLAGHADFTPVHFVRVFMSNSSWPHQLASGVIFTAPVTFFGAHPQDMLESDARDFLQALPTMWDQTLVLPDSRIGELAAFARRKGNRWFIAVMSAGRERELEIPLDFLGQGEFHITAFVDRSGGPVAMRRLEKSVTRDDVLPVHMRSNGGFAAMITPPAD